MNEHARARSVECVLDTTGRRDRDEQAAPNRHADHAAHDERHAQHRAEQAPPPYFTIEEIVGITALKQPAAQVKYLRKIGIRAERRPDGSVLVMREWIADRRAVSATSHIMPKSERMRRGQAT